MGNSLVFAALQLLVQLVESDARAGAAGQGGFAQLGLAVIDDVASLGFVGDLELVAGLGNALQAENLDRSRGIGLFDRVSVIVE